MIKQIICIFISLISISSSFALSDHELKQAAFLYKTHLKKEIALNDLRDTDAYRRIYQICSENFNLSKFEYAKYSAQHVLEIGSLNTDVIEETLLATNYSSPELIKDLDHPAFDLAMKDCGNGVTQTVSFIVNLLLVDSVGKLVGTIGVLTFYKYLTLAIKRLAFKSPKSLLALKALGFGFGINEIWKYFNPEKEQAPSKVNPNTKVISSAEDLDAIFNRPESQKKQSKFKERVLNILNSKLERLEQQLLIPGINDLEIQKLEDQILDLNIKITSITQES